MTNADRIRTMTDEELAEYLFTEETAVNIATVYVLIKTNVKGMTMHRNFVWNKL